MRIERYRFGSMTIDGRTYQKDLKIVDGEVVPDWWRGEGHSVEEEDVWDVLAAKPQVLVIGMGEPGRMQVTVSLKNALAGAGIELIEEPTAQAIETFNRLLQKSVEVAGAFHLTC